MVSNLPLEIKDDDLRGYINKFITPEDFEENKDFVTKINKAYSNKIYIYKI